MELLYNPDVMPEEEVKATFVARGALLDELVSLVAGQPDGAGVQHAVIIAPRGMGKTTMLRMVQFAVKDRGLADRWLALKFPEESYGVYDLADLWLETLDLIAAETEDDELRRRAAALKERYPGNDDLQEAALAALKDWRRRDGRRLLLLVENFDEMLAQINDGRDNARLRDVLMNDGTMMLLGGATTFFKEARAYDQPLYNFFKIYNLADLRFAEMQDLLRRRAEVDRAQDFEEKLKANASRLRALEYFTGGNPRLVLMLYRVVSRSALTEVRRALDQLLDEVTPYYKAKVDALPPQQRKILDHIARISGQTNEGLTPGEIAKAVRLPPNQVSAQLKRLSELGYVRAANLRGRSSYYTLSEPLYAVWHQMRFGRSARERMRFLILFLQVLYSGEELSAEGKTLELRFREHLYAGRLPEARDVLEHHRYLAEAMLNEPARSSAMEHVIRGHLDLKDIETVRQELLVTVNLSHFSDETLRLLYESDCISEEELRFSQARRYLAVLYRNAEGVLRLLDQRTQVEPDSSEVRIIRGIVLALIGRHGEAVHSYDSAIKLLPGDSESWKTRRAALLLKFSSLVEQAEFRLAESCWKEVLESNRQAEGRDWLSVAFIALLWVAEKGHLGYVRRLIAEFNLDATLFALACAIDYLLSGDEALIEKLSPEVRGVVEETVVRLRPAAEKETRPAAKSRARKPKTGARR
jgi:DNA-binding transcriptional ArsR family regulator